MSDKKQGSSFVKQAAVLAFATFFSRFLGFVYRVPLTDMIGDEGNGIYGKAYIIYNFFLVMSSAGMPAAISKLVSEHISLGRRDEAYRLFRVALLVSSAFGFICMLVLFFGAKGITTMLGSPRSYYSLIALAPTVFIVAIMAVFRGYFQGLGTTMPTALSQVVEQIFNAAFTLILASAFMKMAAEDLPAMGAAGATAGTGVGAIFGLLAVLAFYFVLSPLIKKDARLASRKYKKHRQESAESIAGRILRTAVPIIAGTAVFSISGLIDSLMVTQRLIAGGASPETADILFGQLNGKYTLFTTLPVSIATVMAAAAIPSVSSSVILKEYHAVEGKINTSLRLTMLICVPAAAGIGVLGVPIIQLLFPKYNDGGILLQIGAVNIIFMALNQILTGTLQATGNIRVPVIAAAIGSLAKIILNYFLIAIPEINVKGAVIGTFVCYAIASAINWIALRDRTGIRISLSQILAKPVLCAAIMGGICYVLYNLLFMLTASNNFSALAAIFAGIMVYFIFLMLVKGITKSDLRLVPYGKKLAAFLEYYKLI